MNALTMHRSLRIRLTVKSGEWFKVAATIGIAHVAVSRELGKNTVGLSLVQGKSAKSTSSIFSPLRAVERK